MRKLSYVSFIFAAGMIFTYFVVLYYSGADIIDDQNYFNKIKQFDIHGIPYFFGIALLNFLGNNTSLNLRACMKDQSQFKFVFTFSSILVCSLGSFIGGLGYIRFGDDVKDIILLSLPDTKITLFVRVLYCFWLLGSYPLQMYSIIDIIERNDFYKSIPSFENIDIRYYAIRTLLVLTTAVVASTISKVGLFLNFSGSFAGTALGFIIPVIAYEKVFSGKMSTSTIIMNRCILIFGIVFGTIWTVISFISLIQEF